MNSSEIYVLLFLLLCQAVCYSSARPSYSHNEVTSSDRDINTSRLFQDLNVDVCTDENLDPAGIIYYDFFPEHKGNELTQAITSQDGGTCTSMMHSDGVKGQDSDKLHYLVSRELSFARARLANHGLTLEQWYQLLNSNDPQAVEIKARFAEKSESDRRLALLQKKLRNRPDDPQLIAQLRGFDKSKEEFLRQRHMYETRKPMSKYKRDRLIHHLAKFRMEIEDFKRSGRLKKLRCTRTPKRLEAKKKREESRHIDDKFAEGDAEADEVTVEFEKLRRLFHQAPLDHDAMYPHWLKVDSWMRLHKDKYLPLDLPTEWPNTVATEALEVDADEDYVDESAAS